MGWDCGIVARRQGDVRSTCARRGSLGEVVG